MSRFAIQLVGLWAAGMAVLLGLCWQAAGGRLMFTLDDTYIHLSLVETLLTGMWGVNPGEAASPSSSILYPFLLMPGEALGFGPAWALVICLIAAALSVLVMARLVEAAVEPGPRRWLVGGLGLFVVSGFALPMTGLEHSLHVLATLVALAGVAALAEGKSWPWTATVAVIALPLLRFEGLALAGLAIAAQLWCRQWRPALAQAMAIAAGLLAYGLTVRHFGLPLVPSPVSAASTLAEGAGEGRLIGALVTLPHGLMVNLATYQGRILAASVPLIVGLAMVSRGPWLMALVAVLALAAHLLAGQIGGFSRHEVYAVALAFAAILRLVAARPTRGAVLAALAFGLAASVPYLEATIRSPAASRNVLAQQYQLHRLARLLAPAPLAVNDLGWPSYRNDTLVLDLWGLGSEEVRRLRQAGRLDAAALAALAEARGVGVVAIYTDWFGALPESWQPVARLISPMVSSGGTTITILATPLADRVRLETVLDELAAGLPPGASLNFAPLP